MKTKARELIAMQKPTDVVATVDGEDQNGSCGGEPGSPNQARMCSIERHRLVAMQLEIPWETYKTLNGIRE